MRNRVFHPFLFAIFPLTFIYATNLHEIKIHRIFPFLVFSLLLFVVIRLIVSLICNDKIKAGIITTIFLFLFFFYGHFFELVNDILLGLGMIKMAHVIILPVFLLLFFFASRFFLKSKFDHKKINELMNILTIFLLFINIFNITISHIEINKKRKDQKTKDIHQRKLFKISQNTIKKRPNIYYIILDEYAGLNSLKKIYNFINSNFVNQLKERNFFIASNSKTRYKATEKSMAASLNMRYLEKNELSNNASFTLIRNSQVSRILEAVGYQINIFPITPNLVFNNSDRVLSNTHWLYNDFNITVLKTTMFRSLIDNNLFNQNMGNYFRDRILYIFDQLKDLSKEEGPNFFYAHIMCPHYPFVFDENGKPTQPENYLEVLNKKYYLQQLKFINKKVIDTIDNILKHSTVPPIIIIQSDHGPRGAVQRNRKYWLDVGLSWQDIFNAYHIPDLPAGEFDNTMSHVNTFRLIFNIYFGTKYPFLKNL